MRTDSGFRRVAWTLGMLAACGAMQVRAADDVAAGKALYDRWCAACHAPGPGHPGTQALDAMYQGGTPAALEERRNLDAAFVRYHVRHGRSTMPSFRKAEISDQELEQITAYLTRPR